MASAQTQLRVDCAAGEVTSLRLRAPAASFGLARRGDWDHRD